jgi:asparagine synthase (glutamine-hydrolysing)
MCGIAGYIRFDQPARGIDEILAMTRAMRHRGPDDEGAVFIDPRMQPRTRSATDLHTPDTARGAGREGETRFNVVNAHWIALGHRRFAITDPSPAGHQPFWSWDRRLCVVFNGEIYNHVELRDRLEMLGHRFATRSDTEVLLEAYRAWGVASFQRLVGFWAIALYDADRRQILLARDRLGKAPLYIARAERRLWWCSEIAGLRAALGNDAMAVRETAVTDFIVQGVRDVGDETFYESIRTFPRASYAWIGPDGELRPRTWWSLPSGRLAESDLSADEAAKGLRDRLDAAVSIRLRADVPVGIELSGGLDSSALCAIAVQAGADVPIFHAAFPDAEADESPFALSVARHLGCESRLEPLVMQPADLPAQAAFAAHMTEPFHSPGLLANQRLWRAMASCGIRVSINGAAGDELFAGYPGIHHRAALGHLAERRQWRQLDLAVRGFSEDPATRLSRAYAMRMTGAIAHALRLRMPGVDAALTRRRWRSILAEPALRLAAPPTRRPALDFAQTMTDAMGDGLLNYWLRSGHQSAIGVPIEVRLPMLDHRVVEFAFRLPLTYLIRDGWMKWILRRAFEGVLPGDVVWRPRKAGFPFPIARWLSEARQGLCDMALASSCPWIDATTLAARYEPLLAADPMLLWRMLSVAQWWSTCQCRARSAAPRRLAA